MQCDFVCLRDTCSIQAGWLRAEEYIYSSSWCSLADGRKLFKVAYGEWAFALIGSSLDAAKVGSNAHPPPATGWTGAFRMDRVASVAPQPQPSSLVHPIDALSDGRAPMQGRVLMRLDETIPIGCCTNGPKRFRQVASGRGCAHPASNAFSSALALAASILNSPDQRDTDSFTIPSIQYNSSSSSRNPSRNLHSPNLIACAFSNSANPPLYASNPPYPGPAIPGRRHPRPPFEVAFDAAMPSTLFLPLLRTENHQPNQSVRNSPRTAILIGAVSKFHGAAAGLQDGLVSVVEWSSVSLAMSNGQAYHILHYRLHPGTTTVPEAG
ncbi:hypothetical protein BKA56DRAFT_612792 [Ilyonectria sp. MPI-CAGE-AT-0026]|nr:hypothetical protein BKA56DRAFT_612792 [Ilyonectria sp. MPI-CAGE-AT-0026]